MNIHQSQELLKESIIKTGIYHTDNEFLSNKSVSITMDDEPIILLGSSKDIESHKIAERLLSNQQFKDLLNQEYNFLGQLKKKVVHNKTVCAYKSIFNCISKSEQGYSPTPSNTNDELVAVLLDKNALGLGICINDSIMKCFYPDATPLTYQI